MGEAKLTKSAQKSDRLFNRPASVINLCDEMTMEVDVARHAFMLAPMPSDGELSELLKRHRVIVCAGAGGVGKTSMSAALATLGASMGRRTLCLTIDPARRLAQAFGVHDFAGKELDVSEQILSVSSRAAGGNLTLMMLDPRETFDEIVEAGLSGDDVARRVLSHRVYDHLAKNLAGTQAYMAMEKVCSVARDPRYDLIILDTPPSARVLDFFDAPSRMSDILDSPATRALITAMRRGDRLRPGVFGVGMRTAIAAMERVTGSSMLSEMADLISLMNQLLGGFKQRAHDLSDIMKSPDFGYILVTSPDAAVVADVQELARAMKQRGFQLSALICNRVCPGGVAVASDEANSAQELNHFVSDAELVKRILFASDYEANRRARQLQVLAELRASLTEGHNTPLICQVPELPVELSELHNVWRFAELLRAS